MPAKKSMYALADHDVLSPTGENPRSGVLTVSVLGSWKDANTPQNVVPPLVHASMMRPKSGGKTSVILSTTASSTECIVLRTVLYVVLGRDEHWRKSSFSTIEIGRLPKQIKASHLASPVARLLTKPKSVRVPGAASSAAWYRSGYVGCTARKCVMRLE